MCLIVFGAGVYVSRVQVVLVFQEYQVLFVFGWRCVVRICVFRVLGQKIR